MKWVSLKLLSNRVINGNASEVQTNGVDHLNIISL